MGGSKMRHRLAVVGVMGAMFCLALVSVVSADPMARAARTVIVNDTIRLTLVRKSGNILHERGTATGTFPGTVNARFDVSGVTKVTGRLTFYPDGGGSLTLNAVGYPESLGTVARFSGDMAVRRGTGRFARALGSGTFSGTVNRRTWRINVTARASLRY